MVQCSLISIYFDFSFTNGGENGANFNDELNKFYHINMELTPYDLILPLFTLWKKYSMDIKTSILVPFLFDYMVFLLSRKPYIIME